MRKDKIKNALWNAYRLAYKQSTPSADFDELVVNAEINKDGQKQIKYNDYFLNIDEQERIVDLVSQEHKLTKTEKKTLQANYHLGSSPRCVEK